jgi:hypothetical protein
MKFLINILFKKKSDDEIMEALRSLSITEKIDLDFSNDFPFLIHEPTIDFIKKSKV